MSMDNKELEHCVRYLEEQFNRVMDYFFGLSDKELTKCKCDLKLIIKENEYGGNPDISVEFSYLTPLSPIKRVFKYQPASKTRTDFINEIKAWMFDVVDSFMAVV